MTSESRTYDVAIIGGGIVGLATALALIRRKPDLRLVVLEKESQVGAHQTGHNSGVIHSGLYYTPGSMKARNCVDGRNALYQFCDELGIPFERCGKIVVATEPDERQGLDELERRGRGNGLKGIRRLSPEEAREIEPYVRCVEALHVPETGIVDFQEVSRRMAHQLAASGVEICLKTPFSELRADGSSAWIVGTSGPDYRARLLINCAGLQSDRIARLCGMDPGLSIVPFRGEYYVLAEHAREKVRHLIYPVPDPRFPFLGVHFTRRISGEVEAGPNAVLALSREGYARHSIETMDALSTLSYPGFWRMSARYWRMGREEIKRSWSRRAYLAALQKLVPELGGHDIRPAGCGIRAQAVLPDGSLVDDFRILRGERMVHVLNAPSPAATASLAIGAHIANGVLEHG